VRLRRHGCRAAPPRRLAQSAGGRARRRGAGARRLRRLQIAKKEDWLDLYAKPFFFGCDPDDRMNAASFSKLNPFGARINAIFSSDIGHFDVIDTRQPSPEAYELVEDGTSPPTISRDFTVRLWGTQNKHFFEGTRVAKEAAAVLAAAQPQPSPPPGNPIPAAQPLGGAAILRRRLLPDG
jgi:hypothetical protein